MRPRKLIMSAFGPYANEEIIDFELLNGKKIPISRRKSNEIKEAIGRNLARRIN